MKRASRLLSRRARPFIEHLEDRTVPSVSVIEGFETGLNNYVSRLRYIPDAGVARIGAHDGMQGLVKNDGYEWILRNDTPVRVQTGQTISTWVQFADAADGRAYFGFGATPNGDVASPFNQAFLQSLVLAANTNQLIIQNNNAFGVSQVAAVAVPGGVQANTWYRLEVQWTSATSITGRLYGSDGTTPLASVTGAGNGITSGGLAFRAFGSPKWFDTVVLDSDSTATPAERAAAGGGKDVAWTPDTAPAPRVNGPSNGPAPVPWQYANLVGSNRDVRLNGFNQLQTGTILGGVVSLGAANDSLVISGTTQVTWGPAHYQGSTITPETPLLAQYLFRQRPGEATTLIGSSDVKHFFSSAKSDFQHLNPGESDVYGAGLNLDQVYYTPGSELNPVTGELHRPSHFGALNADGINQGLPASEPNDLVHLLQVAVADLDPAQNPVGTRWFLAGNLWVAGDRNTSDNSRWVEIRPIYSGSNFTFDYPNGSGGTLNFRTIPGLVDPSFAVSSINPSGPTAGPVSTVQVTFTHPVNTLTFDTSDISITGPNGPITDIGLTPVSTTQFNITFSPQGRAGIYTVNIGLDVADTGDVLMDQDRDGTPGEATDGFSGTFTITAPRITVQSPTGSGAAAVSSLTVTFDRPINATTFTLDDIVSFSGPGGPVTVNSITPSTGTATTFNLTFAATQTLAGTYTLVLGPQIEDQGGNPMDQNQNGTPGETTADRYTGTFTITAPRVLSHTPSGLSTAPVSTLNVTFDRPINATTFTLADIVSFTGPEGAIAVNSIAPSTGTATTFTLSFDAQDLDGAYTLVLGPDIRDGNGNPMDQNQNGIPGQATADRYTATFSLGSIGPDGFGYVASTVPIEPIDLVPGGPGVTAILLSTDDGTASIPFDTNTFRFYNTTYTGTTTTSRIYLSPNGLITFGADFTSSNYVNGNLTSTPGAPAMAVLWDDHVTTQSTDNVSPNSDLVLYKFDDVDGDTVADRLIIEWQVFHISSSTSSITFQAVLTLNTGSAPGAFYFYYPDLITGTPSLDNGASATVGIKNNGTQGTNRLLISQDGSNPQLVSTGRGLRFTAAGALQFRQNAYTVNESAGEATVTVTRTAGQLGEVTVQYATSNGTATADEDYTAVTGILTFAAGQVSSTFTIPITNNANLEGNETFNVTLSNPTGGAILGTNATTVVTIADGAPPPTFRVTALTGSANGFTATFSRAFDPTVLNLYTIETGGPGAPDVIVTGPNGPIRGSVVFNATNTGFTFLASGALLPAGDYTVTLRSAADAFKDGAGELLDGNGNGTAGDSYVGSFNVGAPPAFVVSVPDFARGPRQTVDLPGAAAGLPLRLNDGTGVTSVTVRLRYNPSLLSITGAVLGPSAPAGSTPTFSVVGPDEVEVGLTSPTELGAGTVDFLRLTATVPDSAASLYGSKHVLEITQITLNGGALASVGADNGLHLVTYLGDASGNGTISSLDASLALRNAVGLDGGLKALRLADPTLAADANGNGRLDSTDAAWILQKAVGLPRPQLPDLPAGIVIPNPPGIDPLLFLPKLFAGRPGDTLTVPVLLDRSDLLASVDLALSYDTQRLELVTNGVQRGSLTDDFDLLIVNHDAAAGTLRIGLSRTAGPISEEGPGSVVLLTFRIKAEAPAGRAIINLRQSLGGTQTALSEGALELNPAPRDRAGDVLDGVITVLPRRPRLVDVVRDLVFAVREQLQPQTTDVVTAVLSSSRRRSQ